MIKRLEVSEKEYNNFIESHRNGDLLQLTDWAESKKLTGWYYKRIAIGRDDKIEAAATLQFKKIPKTKFTLCYISRGFVVDYSDEILVKALLKEVIDAALEENSYTIKIDPDIPETDAAALKLLKSLGFIHHGFLDGMSKDAIQPRQTMVTDVSLDDKKLLQSFDRNNRTRVRRALRMGTTVKRAAREDLKTFHELMKITGERDGFLTRDITYFESLYDALHDNGHMELFLVELDPKEVKENIQKDIDKVNKDIKKANKIKDETKRNNQLENLNNRLSKLDTQLEEIKEIKEKAILSGALYAQCGEKAYYLYGASSNDYRDFLPNHHMQFSMMQYARENGAKSYDFGGTSVEPPEDSEYFGLWQFKSQWGTEVSNKIGGFDFVLNRPVYYLLNTMVPMYQKGKVFLNKIRK
ncbi:lipid II:glycine glycyltransferase FemX [Nosocomiicoccus ampullae]|uniref:Lipid II:glycine glycyltransferase n=1 Tax=Nosocomiicoccus ampullae TaxID=489910 RepID=A0A9Q2HEQ5_9STAP|nr:lipid II:glycine glycyltransferase FemX [Nosocomiicoccus ampullae]MBB5175554.1 peptidoglycan pentaglycine glycine transferase (the first glycine) [Nosocomiicoccus ampullae]QYA46956.1 lipid II:glycine glycyltransferase FemX [Nosocomiicoccus ampullae]